MSGAASMACEPIIRFGVAGWSYPDWNGTVYPRGVGDRLAYLAEYVDFVEINSTFYRIPSSAQTGRWVRTVERKPAFAFSAKLHQDVTHRGLLEAGSTRLFMKGWRPWLRPDACAICWPSSVSISTTSPRIASAWPG